MKSVSQYRTSLFLLMVFSLGLASCRGVSLVQTPIATDSSVLPDEPQQPGAVVDPQTVYVEEFEGWGTSLAWGGNVVGGWPEPQRSDIADKLFSTTSGLGLNVVRYNIGGGPNPTDENCGAMRPGGDVHGFQPAEGVWDWAADANQRWFLQAAQDRGADVLLAFSDSPPAWMTISGCTNGAANGGNNLRGYWVYKMNDDGAYANTVTYSETPNDSVTLKFQGAQIELYGVRDRNGGIGVISVDDGPETEIDFYAAERVANQLLYASPALLEGEHVLHLRVTDKKNDASSGLVVTLDQAIIDGVVSIDDRDTGTGLNQFDYHWANYEKFAAYLTTVVQHFRDEWGIQFAAFTPLNEPNSNWWIKSNRQEGCAFDQSSQVELINRVAQSLAAKGLNDVRIAVADTYSVDEAVSNWRLYPAETQAHISILTTHAYSARPEAETRLHNIATENGKTLWMTEFGAGPGPYDVRSMSPAFELATRILVDMKFLRPSAWVVWDGIEDDQDNRHYDIMWGLITAHYLDGSYAYSPTRQYYAMGNFGKFIRPGAQIIESGDNHVLAAYHPATQTLVLVAVNRSPDDLSIVHDLSKFSPISTAIPYRTSAEEDLVQLADIPIANNQLAVIVMAKSITTYVMSVP